MTAGLAALVSWTGGRGTCARYAPAVLAGTLTIAFGLDLSADPSGPPPAQDPAEPVTGGQWTRVADALQTLKQRRGADPPVLWLKFEQATFSPLLREPEVSSGVMTRSPDLLTWRTDAPAATLMEVGGGVARFVDLDSGITESYPADGCEATSSLLRQDWAAASRFFEVEAAGVERERWVLRLRRVAGSEGGPAWLELEASRTDGILRRLAWGDDSGGETRIRFEPMEPGQAPP